MFTSPHTHTHTILRLGQVIQYGNPWLIISIALNWTIHLFSNMYPYDLLTGTSFDWAPLQKTYKLINLWDPKFHLWMHMGEVFCVEFQRVSLNFHPWFLAHTQKKKWQNTECPALNLCTALLGYMSCQEMAEIRHFILFQHHPWGCKCQTPYKLFCRYAITLIWCSLIVMVNEAS